MVKTSKFVAALSIVLSIALAAALAAEWFGEGLDRLNYVRIFGEIEEATSIWSLRYEPLFVLFVQLLSKVSVNPTWIFFAVIATALLVKVIGVTTINGNALIFLISYFSLWVPTLELNQIRASLALGGLLLIVSSRRLSVVGILLLSPLTLGLHYSMIGSIMAIWVYLILFSDMAVLKKILLLCGISFLAYFLTIFLIDRMSVYLIIVSRTMQTGDVRLLSFYSIYVMLTATFSGFFIYRKGVDNVPHALVISTISAFGGILVFAYQTIHSGDYSYRILQTLSAFLPVVLAWIWRNSKSRTWKMGVLALLLIGVAIAPRYWASQIT